MEDVQKEEPKPEEILAKKVEEYLQSVERSRHVRPWDVGKEGVNPRGEYPTTNNKFTTDHLQNHDHLKKSHHQLVFET